MIGDGDVPYCLPCDRLAALNGLMDEIHIFREFVIPVFTFQFDQKFSELFLF